MHVSYQYAVLSELAYQTTLAGARANMPTTDSGFGYDTTIHFQSSQFTAGSESLTGYTAASSDFAVTVFKNGGQYVIAFRGSDSFSDVQDSAQPLRGIGRGNYNDQDGGPPHTFPQFKSIPAKAGRPGVFNHQFALQSPSC